MDLSQLMGLIASLASAVAAVLAWVAKIRWSDEYSKAKDETIKAKDALVEVKNAQLQTLITNKDETIKAKEEQIKVLEREVKSLNDLTPMKIREYFLSVREQMEEYNTLLKNQLDEAHNELENKKNEIGELRQKGEKSASEIEKLEKERQSIAEAASALENQLTELQQKYESQKELFIQIPKIDTKIYESIGDSLKNLTEAMSKNYTQDFARISKVILESSKFAQQEQEIFKQILTFRNVYAHAEPKHLLDAEPKKRNLLEDVIEGEEKDSNDSERKYPSRDELQDNDDADPIAA